MLVAKKSTSQKTYHRPKKKNENSSFFRKLNLILFSTFIFVGVSYLVSANDLVVKGVVMQGLKNQAKSLSEDTRAYENKILALQSYGSLKARVQCLNMVAVGNVDYLTVSDSVLAKK
ncbi:MAG: hypothetical protein PHR57_00125 [Patescibacteria group bacterium]|jgi:hypothetical protein|nr:hypothetical protein [Patescibacteria group bacterium]